MNCFVISFPPGNRGWTVERDLAHSRPGTATRRSENATKPRPRRARSVGSREKVAVLDGANSSQNYLRDLNQRPQVVARKNFNELFTTRLIVILLFPKFLKFEIENCRCQA
jgi:hypothetical protein